MLLEHLTIKDGEWQLYVFHFLAWYEMISYTNLIT